MKPFSPVIRGLLFLYGGILLFNSLAEFVSRAIYAGPSQGLPYSVQHHTNLSLVFAVLGLFWFIGMLFLKIHPRFGIFILMIMSLVAAAVWMWGIIGFSQSRIIALWYLIFPSGIYFLYSAVIASYCSRQL